MHQRYRLSGFTWIEVIITLFIMSSALLSLTAVWHDLRQLQQQQISSSQCQFYGLSALQYLSDTLRQAGYLCPAASVLHIKPQAISGTLTQDKVAISLLSPNTIIVTKRIFVKNDEVVIGDCQAFMTNRVLSIRKVRNQQRFCITLAKPITQPVKAGWQIAKVLSFNFSVARVAYGKRETALYFSESGKQREEIVPRLSQLRFAWLQHNLIIQFTTCQTKEVYPWRIELPLQ